MSTANTGNTASVAGAIAVCWKWVSLDGDPRRAGVSAADQAALEVALRLVDRFGPPGDDGPDGVTVVTVGPPAAEAVLRQALAAGASRAVRVDVRSDLPSPAVAAAIADVLAGTAWIVCGDHSADRGSGSVPAFIAAELDAAQALGLVGVDPVEHDSPGGSAVRAVRRLDGGRREVLDVTAPAVLSVEGSVASLRRATLPAELAARDAPVEAVAGPDTAPEPADVVRPFRPRTRVVPPPEGDASLARIRALTDAGAAVSRGETVTLEPPEAAAHIVTALEQWGYLAPAPPATRPPTP